MTGNKTTNGWGKVRVGDALRLINGRAFKPSEWRERGLPIVRIQNLNNAEASFNYYEGDLPEKFLLTNGDLLFAWSGTPGTSFGAHIWRGGKAWLNQHIFKVMFDEAEFNKKFLQLAINQNLNEYIRAAHGGAGLAHITKGRFEQSELVKPTLDEQRDIVAEIEKQFSRLDEAVANFKRVKANLKRYKAAVLKAAVEGELTSDWRKQHPDVEPASKLLERILVERRGKWKGNYKEPAALDTSTLPLLPKGWTWAVTDQLGLVQLGRQRSPKNRSKDHPVKYLRAANITEGGIDLSDLLDMEFSPEEQQRYRLKSGDLLLSEASGSPNQVGKPAVWRDQIPLCCFQNTVIRLRPSVDLSPYLLACFKSYYVNGIFAKVAGGVGINHLSADKFSKVTVPLPPVAEQDQIVAEVERRLSVIEELEAAVEANLTRADRLRQSILTNAFAGKLVCSDTSEGGADIETLKAYNHATRLTKGLLHERQFEN